MIRPDVTAFSTKLRSRVGVSSHLFGGWMGGIGALRSGPKSWRATPARLAVLTAAALVLFHPAFAQIAPAQIASAPTAHQLTEAGARLGSLVSAGAVDDLRLRVAIGADQPVSTHVYAKIGGATLRQRTHLGYWIPWDGNPETLVDNQFPVEDGVIEFKILDQPLGADNQGITLVIGYRTASAFKYGIYAIVPGAGAGK